MISRHTYFLLLEPETIQHICTLEQISVNTSTLYSTVKSHGLKANMALIRACRKIHRGVVQDIMDTEYGQSLKDAKIEYFTWGPMDMYGDRVHTANKLRTPYNRKPAQYMAAAMALAAYNEGGVEATIKKTSRFVMTRTLSRWI